MNSKKAGVIFLIQILLSVGVSLWSSMVGSHFEIGIVLSTFLSEGLIVIPGLLFLAATKEAPGMLMDFKGMDILSCFLVLLFTMFITPLIITTNAFSMIFTENTVVANSADMLKYPFIVMALIVGVVAPVCEEFVFRGIFYGCFRRTGKVFGAILLQAFLFGLMHMNFNQFCYAFVIGIFMGILVEATGSIWSSVLMHAIINVSNVILMYLSAPYYNKMQQNGTLDQVTGPDTMVIAMCFYLIISVFTTAIAICILIALAKRANRLQAFQNIFRKNKEKDVEITRDGQVLVRARLWSLPLVLGVIIAIAFIVLLLI